MRRYRKTYRKGVRYERLLVRQLRKLGFFATRVPVSGRTSLDIRYPDVIAIKSGKTFLIEVKMLSDTRHLYIELERYRELEQIKKQTKVPVLIAIYYYDIGEFIFLPLESVQKFTNRYAVWERSYILERGLRIQDLEMMIVDRSD